MRIIVVGCSGAGKTTLARQIASRLKLKHIAIDAITWQAGWRDLSRSDPDEYARRVTKSKEAEAWVVDQPLPEHLRPRATYVVWLDYERSVVMARVIRRSMLRVVLRTKLWAGNRERLTDMLRPSGPIRWDGITEPGGGAKPRSGLGGKSGLLSRCCGYAVPVRLRGWSSGYERRR